MSKYKWNPKTKDSGIITCIPQSGVCPNGCEDCFFQSGRSYLEPLDENLPHIPPIELTKGRVVRINDGNDSNVDRELVETTAKQFDNYFFNTSIPKDLEKFSGPVVLTVNPGPITDTDFYKVRVPTFKNNLMFVRVRTNMWNLDTVVRPAVDFYTCMEVPVVLTFMAYYTSKFPVRYGSYYEWKKRTINSYWVLNQKSVENILEEFKDNEYVYSCGYKGQHACRFCGNCLREYFNTKERLRQTEENG